MDKTRQRLKSRISRKSTAIPAEPKIKLTNRCQTTAVYQVTALLIFVVLGFFIYSNTLKSPFSFDDKANIQENPHIRITKLALKDIIAAGFKSRSSNRPIANISFALNYYFHRYNVVGYHCTNICIHILTGIFLYLFVKITLSIPLLHRRYHNYRQIAFFAALLWLVHPIQTQSVTYIVQRMNSMAAMFYILSLLLYVKGRLIIQKQKKGWPWFAGCALAGLLSFGCKEITATLPVFIFLYEWFFFQDLNITWLKRRLPHIIGIFIVLFLVGMWYLGSSPWEKILSSYQRKDFTLTERLLTQSRVAIYYISLLAYPHPRRLNLDHSFAVSHSLISPPTTLLCVVAVFGLIGLALYTAKKERLLSFSILWFFGNLAIESSVIGLALVFEHRLYLPSMFVSLAIVATAWRFIKQNWARVGAFCIAALLCCVWTYERNSVWSDPVTLWKDSAVKSPEKPRPHYNLARALHEKGKIDEAVKYYTKTLQLDPNRSDAHLGIGISLLGKGNIDEAVVHLNNALRLDPNDAKAYYNMGVALYKQNKFNEALAHYNRALRIDPKFRQVYNGMAKIFYQQGKIDRAIAYWTEALKLKADWPEVLNDLAWVMATHEEAKYRNAAKSLALAKRACEITDYQDPGVLDTLAAAYASAGKFSQAIETAEKAVNLALSAAKKELAQQIQSHLQLYKAGQPYREPLSAPGNLFKQTKLAPLPAQVSQE